MYRVRISKLSPRNWDQLVASVPEGTIYQTTRWAQFIKQYVGGEPFFITVHQDTNIVGLLLIHKEGLHQQFLKLYFGATLTVPLSKYLFPTLTWRYGPLVLDKQNTSGILNEIF